VELFAVAPLTYDIVIPSKKLWNRTKMLTAIELYRSSASDPVAFDNFAQSQAHTTETIEQVGTAVRESPASVFIGHA
jgi:hypothetical protein